MMTLRLTPEELSARKKRNYAIAGALIVFMVLIFSVTFLRMSSNMDDRRQKIEAGQPVGYAG
jgi:hypothetical protein